MNTQGQNIHTKRIYLAILGVIFIITVLCLFFILFPNEEDDFYILNNAIKKTEAQKSFVIQLDTAAETTVNDLVQRTETSGYVTANEEDELVHIYANTFGGVSDDPQSDFDVTVSMFSDGEKVYDNSSGVNKEVDMTVDEFNEIVNSYSLYRFSTANVSDYTYLPQELEDYGNCGEFTVALKTPESNVMKAYGDKISEITGESVKAQDLKVCSAMVTYSIFDDMIQSQTYSFEVEYVDENETPIKYSVTSKVDYVDTSALSEEYNEFIPIQQEETK